MHSAGIQDRAGVLPVFGQLEADCPLLRAVFADAGYQGFLEQFTEQFCDWRLEIVRKEPRQPVFVVQPKRWVVERTFAWLGKYRRLSKDYEYRPQTSEHAIYWAMTHRMLRQLQPD